MPVQHIDTPNQARFITYSCYQRRPLLGTPALRDRYLDHLNSARRRLRLLLHAWVIMPDHIHLIAIPDGGTIAPVLRALKQGFSRKVLNEWRRAGDTRLEFAKVSESEYRFWQRGGGYDRNIRSNEELVRHTAYIHANPIRRGLVERAEDWRWSSYGAWHGLKTKMTPDRFP